MSEVKRATSARVQRIKGLTFQGEKRTYIPFVIKTVCPHCEAVCKTHLSSEYLSYPTYGEWTQDTWYCHACEEEYEFEYKLDYQLRVRV